MALKKETNKNLESPLQEAIYKRDILKEQVKQHEKHKMSLSNLKSKLITLKDKIHKLEIDSKDLDANYEKVVKEKNELEDKFEKITIEVKKSAEIKNIILNSRL